MCDDTHFVKKSIRTGPWISYGNLNLTEALTQSYMWVHQQLQIEAQHEHIFVMVPQPVGIGATGMLVWSGCSQGGTGLVDQAKLNPG